MELSTKVFNPIERTSTPAIADSTLLREDPIYVRFSSKLDAPLNTVILRGIYGPKGNIINGHFAMQNEKQEYTYITAKLDCINLSGWELHFSLCQSSNSLENGSYRTCRFQFLQVSKFQLKSFASLVCNKRQRRHNTTKTQESHIHPMFILPVKNLKRTSSILK